jgi:hypothetical protein
MDVRNIHPATPDTLSSAARDKRQKAEKAHRLALTLSLNRDRQNLLWYAQYLEREAQALEQQAAQQTRNA